MSDFNCRFCAAPLKDIFLDLGVSPVSNANIGPDNFWDGEVFYPLRVYVCPSCLLVQLPNARPREEIFNERYAYFSSYSESWLKHAGEFAHEITEELGLNASSLVVEVASNDGYLLQYFSGQKIPVLGIEPSANVAAAALEKGITTLTEFFGSALARKLCAQGRGADLLVGNNVLAHVPDLNDFVSGLKILLKPKGVISMEFPHLLKLIERNQFDTIYHEHYSYFSFLAVRKIFLSHDLEIFDVKELPTHGGSLRVYASHSGSNNRRAGRIDKVLREEKAVQLDSLEGYSGFAAKAARVKGQLMEFFLKAKSQGKRVAGYGAPAKGNTLLNFCGIKADMMGFTVDLSPHKQGLFLPGTRIPIFHPSKIKEARPDYVLILPWNLREEITAQLSYIRQWGGKFVVAVPGLEIF